MTIARQSLLLLAACWAASAAATPATYHFATMTATGATLNVVALPTHPLSPANGLRVALSLDNGPIQEMDSRRSGAAINGGRTC